jgi:hydrogenase maturation protease
MVIGVGNPVRGDDAVGLVVAERVRSKGPEIRVVAHTGDVLDLCEVWKGAELAVVVDAIWSEEAAGTILRYDARDAPLPRVAFRRSTHAFGVADAIELARSMDSLPTRLIVYGVVGSCFDIGPALSPAVEQAADELTEYIRCEFATAGASVPGGTDYA